ncbi:MAG: septal ring lytic transglycosylase RlpA family protein [Bradyrhizobium sp.]
MIAAAVLLSITWAAQAETGLASYYRGRGHQGETTCAHRTGHFRSIVTVTHAGHSIRCRVNDRGPFVRGRVIDVSLSAARALGMVEKCRLQTAQGIEQESSDHDRGDQRGHTGHPRNATSCPILPRAGV